MVTAAEPRSYEFGVFTVDLTGGELRKHGVRLKVQERPFQLLVCLLERPGEIVSRDELRQRLWPDGTFVDFDHNISSAINKLRTVLRSDEHTSELQSRLHLVCRLLLEKKNQV